MAITVPHLTNPLATPEQLHHRTSLAALPADVLDAVFVATQRLTQAAGLLLDLPQSVTAQACVVLSRFWLVQSPMAREFADVSAAALYVVAKVGPSPRPPRDLANVYGYLASPTARLFRHPADALQPDAAPADAGPHHVSEGAYHAFYARLLALEPVLLAALSFDVHVALPHALALTYLQALDLADDGAPLGRAVVALLNAALASPQLLYLTHQPHALAAAAVYAAARDAAIRMPACDWWEVFDVGRDELGFLVVALRSVTPIVRALAAAMPSLLLGPGSVTRAHVETELLRVRPRSRPDSPAAPDHLPPIALDRVADTVTP